MFQVLLKFVSSDPIRTMVQVITWHQSGDNQSPGPMMTNFTDAHLRHQVSCLSMLSYNKPTEMLV